MEKQNQENHVSFTMRLMPVMDSKGHAVPECRSLMNVTFTLPDDEMQTRFLEEAAENLLVNLKGHRSVGGIRASIYNAMSREGAETLANFMKDFAAKNG